MKINKVELQKALEIVKPGLANQEIVEQTTSFAFINGRVTTYNDEISISCPVSLNVEGVIRAEELYQLLTQVKQDEITLTTQKDAVLLQAGKSKAGFPLIKEIKLPLSEIDNKGWKKLPENFLEALHYVSFSGSKDASYPILTCINITKDGLLESTDNYRATQYNIDAIPFSFLLPLNAITGLSNLPVTQIKLTKSWVHFRTKDDIIFSCRTFDGEYPDVSELFSYGRKQATKIKFPGGIDEVLDRAKVFTKQTEQQDECVTITLSKEKLVVESKSDYGWFKEQVAADYNGMPISFLISPSFLQDILKRIQQCLLIKDRLLFTGKNWKHIVALVAKQEGG